MAELDGRGIGFRSLTEQIDTATPGGRLIFTALAEVELRERPSGPDLSTARSRAWTSASPYHPKQESAVGAAHWLTSGAAATGYPATRAVEVVTLLLGTGWARGVARETCEPARHEIPHVAAHQLSAQPTGCRHVGSVVHRDTMLVGDSSRAQAMPYRRG